MRKGKENGGRAEECREGKERIRDERSGEKKKRGKGKQSANE